MRFEIAGTEDVAAEACCQQAHVRDPWIVEIVQHHFEEATYRLARAGLGSKNLPTLSRHPLVVMLEANELEVPLAFEVIIERALADFHDPV